MALIRKLMTTAKERFDRRIAVIGVVIVIIGFIATWIFVPSISSAQVYGAKNAEFDRVKSDVVDLKAKDKEIEAETKDMELRVNALEKGRIADQKDLEFIKGALKALLKDRGIPIETVMPVKS